MERFYKALWELGDNSPELREAIAKTITGADASQGDYSIPTKKFILESPADRLPTGEDIYTTAFFIEDEEKRERALALINKIDQYSIKDIAQHLNKWTAYLTLKEAKGEELTPIEKTLKDIDIAQLAIIAVFGA